MAMSLTVDDRAVHIAFCMFFAFSAVAPEGDNAFDFACCVDWHAHHSRHSAHSATDITRNTLLIPQQVFLMLRRGLTAAGYNNVTAVVCGGMGMVLKALALAAFVCRCQ
jgi:hypothetical protein